MKTRTPPAPKGFTYRRSLPAGSSTRPVSGGFLRRLKALDPKLELHFFPRTQRWSLYRCPRRGVTPAEDPLWLVGHLFGERGEYREPGDWLIHELQRDDFCRRLGTTDPERAQHLQREREDQQEADLAAAHEKKAQHIRDEFVADAHMCAVERTSTCPTLYKAANKKRDPVRGTHEL